MDIYIARQPILDRNGRIVAYEMLFRESIENRFTCKQEIDYTKKLLSNLYTIGINTLIGNKQGFINFNYDNLLSDIAYSLDKEKFIIEILESVKIDYKIIKKCKELKKDGYVIAIDDFVFGSDISPIIDYIDIIKVDFKLNDKKSRELSYSKYKKLNKLLLAEKIEDKAEYFEALELGYDFFQGFFLSKPSLIKDYDIGVEKKNHKLILEQLKNKVVDKEKVKKVFKLDVGLSYKLLRYINTFKIVNKAFNSIEEAIDEIGIDEVRKWFYLIYFTEDEYIDEDIRSHIALRAKFCENIATIKKLDIINEIFLASMFMDVDEILNIEMNEVLKDIYLHDTIGDILLGENILINDIVALAISYQRDDNQKIESLRKKLNLTYEQISKAYLDALEWSSRHNI